MLFSVHNGYVNVWSRALQYKQLVVHILQLGAITPVNQNVVEKGTESWYICLFHVLILLVAPHRLLCKTFV